MQSTPHAVGAQSYVVPSPRPTASLSGILGAGLIRSVLGEGSYSAFVF